MNTKLPVVGKSLAFHFNASWEHLADILYANHCDKGFARAKVNQTTDWHLAQIGLMHEELSEGLSGLRKDLMDDKITTRKAIEVELADCVIRIMNYARETDLDIPGAIYDKHAYNISRPFMHGKKA